MGIMIKKWGLGMYMYVIIMLEEEEASLAQFLEGWSHNPEVVSSTLIEGTTCRTTCPTTCLRLSLASLSRPTAGPTKSFGTLATGLGGVRPSTPFMSHDPPRLGLPRT